MSDLRAAEAAGMAGEATTYGGSGVGYGVDLAAEVVRLRAMLTAVVLTVENLRATYNAHTHGGAVAAPAGGELAALPLRPV